MPTDAMFDLMKEASRGDDVYGVRCFRCAEERGELIDRVQEDEATNELQDRVAKLAGKEAGLFCVSGTMVSRPLELLGRTADSLRL